MMECFTTINNGWKLLTIVVKLSILDVFSGGPDDSSTEAEHISDFQHLPSQQHENVMLWTTKLKYYKRFLDNLQKL